MLVDCGDKDATNQDNRSSGIKLSVRCVLSECNQPQKSALKATRDNNGMV